MNATVTNMTVVIQYRDSFTKAVTKNVIVVVLSISINYINSGLIHTFQKNQVWWRLHSIVIHSVVVIWSQLILFVVPFQH